MLPAKLYAITDTQLSNCTHAEIVARMLAGGAKLIQLRDKEASAKDMMDAARECLELTRAAGAKLIINDRVDVALVTDADGVHLGQDDLTVAEARAMLGPDKIIGVSTHSLAQVEAALATSANYLAIGPIFSTTTKLNPDPVVGSKRSNASTLAKTSVSLPPTGTTPCLNRCTSAKAPQISLPWVSACTNTFGPARPESSTCT